MEPREAGGVLEQQHFSGKHNNGWFTKNKTHFHHILTYHVPKTFLITNCKSAFVYLTCYMTVKSLTCLICPLCQQQLAAGPCPSGFVSPVTGIPHIPPSLSSLPVLFCLAPVSHQKQKSVNERDNAIRGLN